MQPATTVVGCDVEFIADGPHLRFKNDKVLAAGSDDADDKVAGLFQGARNWQGYRSAYAPADDCHPPIVFNLRRVPQRAQDVSNNIANCQAVH